MSIYPWQGELWQRLTAERERLPHALLLHGAAGIGKRALAMELARWLLCQAPTAAGGCGECPSCLWFAQGGHPDFRLIEPASESETAEEGKKGGKRISVDQVREVVEFLTLSAHQGGWRAVVLQPAEALGVAAANALLKTLEEPPPRTVFLLVSHQPRRLLPTILSRCRKLPVASPEPAAALAWLREQAVDQPEVLLAEAGGAPLLALDHAEPERLARRQRFIEGLLDAEREDLSALAGEYQQRVAEAWGWLARWLCDLSLCQTTGQVRFFTDHAEALGKLAERVDANRLWAVYRQVMDDGRWLQHPLNGQLLLESWLIRYAELGARR
ncbi:MAG: DNA polymerase III subunit delta' [Hydrogenophilaceae bacterium]|nr:DNA polymerase III subunit delta' [Hydrogenophilaceae bacterium]